MINGAHVIISSTDSEADRAFLRDVLGLPHVDVGRGWLIFGLPPAELAVHPSNENGEHALYLMCADIAAFAAAMRSRGMTCAPVEDMSWGLLSQVTLPGGGTIGVYEPKHARPEPMSPARSRKPARAKSTVRPRVKPQARRRLGARTATGRRKARR